MTELYLIAHCVRGKAAFDVAVQMECPHCAGLGEIGSHPDKPMFDCLDCEGVGYWWIISTSGHRAYPYWFKPLTDMAWDLPYIELAYNEFDYKKIEDVPEMPPAWPDHYKVNAAPKLNITSLFRAAQPPKPTIARRL